MTGPGAALTEAADGYMSGAITGFIAGGLTSNVCFVAGTAVLSVVRKVAIENVEVGDYVEWLKKGKRNDKNFSFTELIEIAKKFLDK